mmetsp:Transcript_2412/g.6106  ORF Transcript_2412/g.6106 Transcript_2412/m.6106 type:complete len:214 (-) Transcript_2412:695-1336(-)
MASLSTRYARLPGWASSASDTLSRVDSSSTNLLPALLSMMPPTPRSFSGARNLVPAPGSLGSTKPVGCTCTCSKSTMAAPHLGARSTTSPVAQGPLVVARPADSGEYFSSMALFAPKPPVARITASAGSTSGSAAAAPSAPCFTSCTPATWPPAPITTSVSLYPSRTVMPGVSLAFLMITLMMDHPTLPPTGLVRERGTECPPRRVTLDRSTP